MTTILACRDLEKRFPHRGGFICAVQSATAEFAAGEWTALRGHSGSGKSTFLHLLSGLEIPTAGDITFLGHSFRELGVTGLCRLRRSRMRVVLQDIGLIAHLTAQENVELPGLLSGADPAMLRTRSAELFQSLRLDHRRDHLPEELSGGERQRTAIARALMADDGQSDAETYGSEAQRLITQDAKVIVADEPTSNVDSRSAQEIGAIFAALARRGLCVITATHDDRLVGFADRVLEIEDGKLSQKVTKP